MRAGNFLTVMLLLSLAAVSCRQDNIFQIIASETAPRKPRIEGAPTNMVVFKREYPGREPVSIMYVASGRLHWYAKAPGAGKLDEPQWDLGEYAIPQPGGKIISLAVTKDPDDPAKQRLYALCRDGNGVNAILRYIKSGGDEWEPISSGAIQSIYADPESQRLFAGTGKNIYDILYLDNTTDTLKPLLEGGTSIFSGAVYRGGIHYLSTRGNGIFQVSEDDLAENNVNEVPQLTDTTEGEENNSRMFMSMIKLKGTTNTDTIIAVERAGGALYEVHDGSFERMRYTQNDEWVAIGKYATKALALWEDTERGLKQLIAGIQGGLYSTTTSSYTYGYVEFELTGDPPDISARYDPPSQSVHYQDRYTTSLGKHPINHLFQTPPEIDPNMTFFASTQTAGLWSYRDREKNGGWQWNAEE